MQAVHGLMETAQLHNLKRRAEGKARDDQRPDLVVRFGRGPKMPSSLRRPVDAVLA